MSACEACLDEIGDVRTNVATLTAHERFEYGLPRHHALLSRRERELEEARAALRWVWLATYPRASVPAMRKGIFEYVDAALKDDPTIADARRALEAHP